MPKVSAKFDFILDARLKFHPGPDFCDNYSIKALLLRGDECLLELRMSRRIDEFVDHSLKDGKIYDRSDELKICGLFSCDLRKGVAPFIQLENKRGKLAIVATHLMVTGHDSQPFEVDLNELPREHRIANEWRLH